MTTTKPERSFVLRVNWEDRQAALRAIRHSVFVQEQSVPANEEWDGQDEHCIHFLALNEAGVPLGCARLQANGKVERMAVLEPARNLGIGAKLLQAAIEAASDIGLTDLYLHAQRQAEPFYQRMGFLAEGETFVEANIDHVRMTKALPLPFANTSTIKRDTTTPAIKRSGSAPAPGEGPDSPHSTSSGSVDGKSTRIELATCKGEVETRNLLIESIQRARRSLLLYSQELDDQLLDNADIIHALSAFVRTNRGNKIQVLFHSSRLAVSRGHRLVELARRLESKIQLRLVPAELATEQRAFACWDQLGYWLLPNFQEYVGMAHFEERVLASRLTESFERTWQRSTLDPDLRVLSNL